jgi:hypothetical protein
MATTAGGDDSEWQKLPCEEKVQHKVFESERVSEEDDTRGIFIIFLGMESSDDRL